MVTENGRYEIHVTVKAAKGECVATKEIVKIMLSKEEFENAINSLKDKLDETTQAMISEELIALMGAYNSLVDEKAEIEEEKAKLRGAIK